MVRDSGYLDLVTQDVLSIINSMFYSKLWTAVPNLTEAFPRSVFVLQKSFLIKKESLGKKNKSRECLE